MSQRRIKVRGIRRDEIDTDKLALAYWLMAKRTVEEKRAKEAEEKAGGLPAGHGEGGVTEDRS